MSESPLSILVGEVVSGVCFVADYVEFHFNGPVLRSLTFPILECEHSRVQFPSEGSRDALCLLIGKMVKEVFEKNEGMIRLRFESGEVLTIPLDGESTRKTGGEGAHFMREGRGDVLVW